MPGPGLTRVRRTCDKEKVTRVLMGKRRAMLKRFRSGKGQAISGEYLVTVAFVVVALAIMSTYIRRTLQAKAYDAQQKAVSGATVALGRNVAMEYEPYYVLSSSNTDARQEDFVHIANAGEFNKTIALERGMSVQSYQLAPAQVE